MEGDCILPSVRPLAEPIINFVLFGIGIWAVIMIFQRRVFIGIGLIALVILFKVAMNTI